MRIILGVLATAGGILALLIAFFALVETYGAAQPLGVFLLGLIALLCGICLLLEVH